MEKDRFLIKLKYFLDSCNKVKNLSYDNKHKVGCLIIDKNMTKQYSMGYNGNYSGGPNERDSNESGQSGYIHGEINALLKLNIIDRDNCVLICTWTN